jgi:protein-tyrosine phosphatase
MTPILVVCTGNVCRSPIAEGVLRSLLVRRFGDAAPPVASAGTSGWDGSPADPGSVTAARELGVDISGHRGRRLTEADLDAAALVLTMAAEHRDDVRWLFPPAAERAFTLKEAVRLLEALPDPGPELDPAVALADRVAEADALRRSGFKGNPRDEDVADPLGMPIAAFRAVASEIEAWSERLSDALFGPVRARVDAEGS